MILVSVYERSLFLFLFIHSASSSVNCQHSFLSASSSNNVFTLSSCSVFLAEHIRLWVCAGREYGEKTFTIKKFECKNRQRLPWKWQNEKQEKNDEKECARRNKETPNWIPLSWFLTWTDLHAARMLHVCTPRTLTHTHTHTRCKRSYHTFYARICVVSNKFSANGTQTHTA